MELDQRPIKPSKQYLYQLEQAIQVSVKPKQYLRKTLGNIVPSQRKFISNLSQKINLKTVKKKNSLSKAQIYQKIKKQNIKKFGQNHSKSPKIKEGKKQLKKIKSTNISVGYTHKNKIKTNENKTEDEKKIIKSKSVIKPEKNKKQKYEKLLEIMTHQRELLKADRAEFQKQAEALHFKQKIQSQAEVPFMKHLRYKTQKILRQNNEQKNKCYNYQQRQRFSARVKNQAIISIVQQNKEHFSDIKQKITQYKIINNINTQKYSILQLQLLPQFTIHKICQLVNLNTLLYDNNKLYKEAKLILGDNLNLINSECTRKSNSSNQIKTRKLQNHRIRQFSNGWVQIWHPGVQRSMINTNYNYKVIWLRKSDVKQYFPNKIISYYCALQNFVQLIYNQSAPVYYFPELQQFEQSDNMNKQMIFLDQHVSSCDSNQ